MFRNLHLENCNVFFTRICGIRGLGLGSLSRSVGESSRMALRRIVQAELPSSLWIHHRASTELLAKRMSAHALHQVESCTRFRSSKEFLTCSLAALFWGGDSEFPRLLPRGARLQQQPLDSIRAPSFDRFGREQLQQASLRSCTCSHPVYLLLAQHC